MTSRIYFFNLVIVQKILAPKCAIWSGLAVKSIAICIVQGYTLQHYVIYMNLNWHDLKRATTKNISQTKKGRQPFHYGKYTLNKPLN